MADGSDSNHKDDIISEIDAPAAPLVEQEAEGEERKKARRGVAESQMVERLSDATFTIFERLDFLWRTHNYISSNIRLADTKAAVIIVISTSLIGSLYAAGLHRPLLFTAPQQWAPVAWFTAAAFSTLSIAVILGAWSLHPRLWWKDRIDHVFWENILAHGTSDKFWEVFRSESPENLERGLSSNIFILAALCRAKFRCLLWATWLAIAGGGVGAALLLVRRN